MPLYEYLCRSCGKGFEMLRRMIDADTLLECPNCHSNKVERQFSTFAAGAAARPVRAVLPERDSPRPVGRSFGSRV